MTSEALSGGFADPARDAARAFRALLSALARPGRVEPLSGALPPAPLSVAAGTLLLTLADGTTPVHLASSHDAPALRDWLRFHCGCPLVDAAEAVFAVGTWRALHPLDRFAVGTPDYPDRSATLVVELAGFDGPNVRISGPGIRGSGLARLPDVAGFNANNALYPLGFDCYFTKDDRVYGLPRSTAVEAA